jgi:O-methyltransferase
VAEVIENNKPLPLWETDATFRMMAPRVLERSLLNPARLYYVYQFATAVQELEGEAAEVGVYRGGTARALGEIFLKYGKTVHLFDTFAGMPTTDEGKDLHKTGDFGDTSVEAVRGFLSDLPNVRFYPGIFPGTCGPVEDKRFAFVHVDVDIHASVRACCEFFYPRMNRAGIMLFDDYGFPSCPGAKTAVDEFFAGKKERLIYYPSGQGVIIKL